MTHGEPDYFLMSREWRVVRMRALERDGARCACCGATAADGVRINVDHIKNRRQWPELALDVNNLQVLCNPCNHGKGNKYSTDWRRAHASGGRHAAERYVVGALLLDNDRLAEVCPTLRVDHFAQPVNAMIYATIADIIQRGQAADVVTVCERLIELSEFETFENAGGGLDYLGRIVRDVPTAADCADYARQLMEART